jgi:hypothetical protein
MAPNVRFLAAHHAISPAHWSTVVGLATGAVTLAGLPLAAVTGQLTAPATGSPGTGQLIAAMAILGIIASWAGTWLWNLASSQLSPALAGLSGGAGHRDRYGAGLSSSRLCSSMVSRSISRVSSVLVLSDPQLNVGGPARPLVQNNRVVPKRVLQLGLHVFHPGLPPADARCLRLWLGRWTVWALCARVRFGHRGPSIGIAARRRCDKRLPGWRDRDSPAAV